MISRITFSREKFRVPRLCAACADSRRRPSVEHRFSRNQEVRIEPGVRTLNLQRCISLVCVQGRHRQRATFSGRIFGPQFQAECSGGDPGRAPRRSRQSCRRDDAESGVLSNKFLPAVRTIDSESVHASIRRSYQKNLQWNHRFCRKFKKTEKFRRSPVESLFGRFP